MLHRSIPLLGLLFCAALQAGCAGNAEHAPADLVFEAIDVPAAPGSAEPNLFSDAHGRLYLSWVSATDTQAVLRYAMLRSGGWSPPGTIAAGSDWFVNWADFPSLVAFPDGALAAHFLQKSGAGTYAYGVRITRSADGGASWSAPVTPHRDGTPTEHGFVSLVPQDDGRLLAVWLDGRNFSSGGHGGTSGSSHGEATDVMTLRAAVLPPEGGLTDEAELDPSTCDCCQTAAVATDAGVVVFYRGRTADEVRDIRSVRLEDGRWSAPVTVHEDGWVIPGCPVNGPAAATDGRRIAVAWYTGAHDAPHVLVAFSEDDGRTFTPPVTIDDGRPIGRVDVALTDEGAFVSWLEQTDAGAEIRVRPARPDGTTGKASTVAQTTPARAGGFPHLARSNDALYVAWTEPGEPARLRMAKAALPD